MTCSGMLGKQCSCGQWHHTSEPEGPGMAVSRWVYALGAVCIAAWICAISAGAYWLVP